VFRHSGGDRQADAFGGSGHDGDLSSQIEQRRHFPAPQVVDFLCADCRSLFNAGCRGLSARVAATLPLSMLRA
jgi:hypothetical protein